MLHEIHKWFHDVPVRLVISNSGFYTENISSLFEYHLKSNLYIKDVNDSLCKLISFPSLPGVAVLCTVDVVGLYTNISNDEWLITMRKDLDLRKDKKITWLFFWIKLGVILKEVFYFSDCGISSLVWWKHIYDFSMHWQHGGEDIKKFLEILNSYYPSIHINANNLREKISFLDVEVMKKGN